MKRTLNLDPVPQIDQKIWENFCPCLYLSIGQEDIQKCTLFHVQTLILMSQIW